METNISISESRTLKTFYGPDGNREFINNIMLNIIPSNIYFKTLLKVFVDTK